MKIPYLFIMCLVGISLTKAHAQVKKIPIKVNRPGKTAAFKLIFTNSKVKSSVALAMFTSPSYTRILNDGTILRTTLFIKNAPPLKFKQSSGAIKQTVRNKKSEKGDEWICESSQMRVSLDDNSFMNAANEQQTQNIYPGAIYTFDNFFNGSFKNETAPRNPIRLTSSAAGITGNIYEDIANPTPSDIKNSVNKLFNRMPARKVVSGYNQMVYECNSAADMALKIGAGASGYGISASFDYKNSQKSEHRYFMIDATQEMYSLNAEVPDDGLFKNSADAAKPNLMMMGTVTYGQRVLVSIETTIKTQEEGTRVDAKYSGFGASANINLANFLKEVNSETSVKMYVVGGENQGFLTLDKNSLMYKLNTYFAGTNYQNSKPIRYQFRNMNNEVIVSNSATDFFPTRQCVPNEGNMDYKITVKLKNISNTTNQMESVKLGLSQWVDAIVNGNPISNNNKETAEIVCWWAGVCEEPRMLKGSATMDRSRTFTIKQTDIMNGAYVDIWTKYIAMYRTKVGGSTNGKQDNKGFKHDKVFLKDIVLASGGGINKTIEVNFNSRVFSMNYGITAQPVSK